MTDYLTFLKDCFPSIVALLGRNSVVVQLVACSNPEAQLPAYLETMRTVGLEETDIKEFAKRTGRIWRTVPNRKWYADLRGNISASNEVLLIHRKASR